MRKERNLHGKRSHKKIRSVGVPVSLKTVWQIKAGETYIYINLYFAGHVSDSKNFARQFSSSWPFMFLGWMLMKLFVLATMLGTTSLRRGLPRDFLIWLESRLSSVGIGLIRGLPRPRFATGFGESTHSPPAGSPIDEFCCSTGGLECDNGVAPRSNPLAVSSLFSTT